MLSNALSHNSRAMKPSHLIYFLSIYNSEAIIYASRHIYKLYNKLLHIDLCEP